MVPGCDLSLERVGDSDKVGIPNLRISINQVGIGDAPTTATSDHNGVSRC